MIGALKTVGIYVDDQAAAEDFYVNQLGFEVRRRLPMGPNASWLEVAPSGAETALVIYPKSMTPDWAQHQAALVFYCADIPRTIEQLRGQGVRITMEPDELPWGMFAGLEDPDGNSIGLTDQAIARDPTLS